MYGEIPRFRTAAQFFCVTLTAVFSLHYRRALIRRLFTLLISARWKVFLFIISRCFFSWIDERKMDHQSDPTAKRSSAGRERARCDSGKENSGRPGQRRVLRYTDSIDRKSVV